MQVTTQNYSAQINNLDIASLKQLIAQCPVGPVLEAAFDALQAQLSEDEFIAYCDSL